MEAGNRDGFLLHEKQNKLHHDDVPGDAGSESEYGHQLSTPFCMAFFNRLNALSGTFFVPIECENRTQN